MCSNNENKPLESVINAIMKNDVAKLKQLREAGEDFTSCDEDSNTLLHLAILSKTERGLCESHRKFSKEHLTRADVFDYLLTINEINKDAKNEDRNTAVMDVFMFLQDSPDWAIKLIKSGCDIDGLFSDGSTALHWAIYNDWDEVAELLIENGCEIDSRDYDGDTPLHLACKLGLVDLVWMLLFYGADPKEGNCFDLVVKDCIKNEVREIFESLTNYEKVFNLVTFVEAMEQSPELFYKLCDVSDGIAYGEDELTELCTRLHRLNPELFKIFVKKYDYVIRHMFKACWLESLGSPKKEKTELETYATNIFTLFESDAAECIVKVCNSYQGIFTTSIICFVSCFEKYDELDLLTKVIFCMLSYGIKVPAELLDRVYYKYGYCSLFKMLLHMRITGLNEEFSQFIPRIFYDISLTPRQLFRYIKYSYKYFRKDLHLIFDYFALPKLVEISMDRHFEYIDQFSHIPEMFRGELADEDDFGEVLVKRVERLPVVPKLVELARNKAREFIISKYDIKSCGQFYTIIKWLPISKIHKEILTYQRKLYE